MNYVKKAFYAFQISFIGAFITALVYISFLDKGFNLIYIILPMVMPFTFIYVLIASFLISLPVYLAFSPGKFRHFVILLGLQACVTALSGSLYQVTNQWYLQILPFVFAVAGVVVLIFVKDEEIAEDKKQDVEIRYKKERKLVNVLFFSFIAAAVLLTVISVSFSKVILDFTN